MPALPFAPARAVSLGLLREARDVLVSLKFTVVLLVFSMVLVFAGTLDQVNLGIWAVQEKFFRSFVVYTQIGPIACPVFPGGYTIGGLLLLNLIAAHVYRFSFTWKKAGIVLTHLGLIVLLVGELLTGWWQQDFQLRLDEGETKNYAESFQRHELVLIETTADGFDEVVAVPERLLARKTPVEHPRLPFRIATKVYYPNSSLHLRSPANGARPPVTVGVGDHVTAAPLPVTYRQDDRNVPSAVVEFVGPDGPLGSYLASGHFSTSQVVNYRDRSWRLGLRVERRYLPFSLRLVKFSHDRYAGTEIPKNFSSRLRLTTPDRQDDREVLVYMNNPLRHGGYTFYQAGFENNDRTTILQVVRNPSWLVPYVACAMMTLGLTLQFAMHLVRFVARRQPSAKKPAGLRRQVDAAPNRSREESAVLS